MYETLKTLNYYDELIKILFENKSGVIASNIAAPIIVFYILIDYLPLTLLISLFFILIILGFFRLHISKKGLNALNKNNKSHINKYLKQVLRVIFLTSTLLSILLAICVYYVEPIQLYFLLSLVFVILSGSMTTTTSVFHAYILFNLPILTIFSISLFISGDTNYILTGVILIIFAIITVPASFRIYSSLKTNIEYALLIKNQQDQLLQSEKMASMGEMMGNIAHQWRQPLSAISSQASGLIFIKECGNLTDNDFKNSLENIISHTNYLSKTIDTFRNFIKGDKEFATENLHTIINTSQEIVNSSLYHNDIKLQLNIDNNKTYNVKAIASELSQVFINIINNAQDILIEKNIKEPTITILLKEIEGFYQVSIEDNAGGIPEEIKDKIFEPYFTTKHQSTGTGIGLHMSYQIVKDSHNGNIYVHNTENGAKFYIELPKV